MSKTNNRIDQTYDELEVGQVFRSGGRTVTETDVVNFCAFTGNWIEIHSNVQYASKTRFGKRLVQGSLTYSIVTGLIQFGLGIQANYGIDNMRFLAPVFIGDTIYAVCEVIGKKEKDDKYGVIKFLMKAVNQEGVVVQKGEWSLLMLRRREDLDALVSLSLPEVKD
ncbi:MaoC/PaaZ C-terminal domain-containing protein [Paraburkholderia sp. BL10I2N1]|uniref:MaoC family dehydratase n=1 Tax=unclassified Paraburkholderia TaxID=2615204 RepID=UPI0010405352|nr:MaoC/PaaZ C-terminal domain-containing protein [Paraburkholderia sp. BL10I2N1]TCG02340.1 dehydratase [Paraburkholderia strydomiana]TDN62394.1 acyl dehydratase [Paraburkholderia sp. BL10I2N1]